MFKRYFLTRATLMAIGLAFVVTSSAFADETQPDISPGNLPNMVTEQEYIDAEWYYNNGVLAAEYAKEIEGKPLPEYYSPNNGIPTDDIEHNAGALHGFGTHVVGTTEDITISVTPGTDIPVLPEVGGPYVKSFYEFRAPMRSYLLTKDVAYVYFNFEKSYPKILLISMRKYHEDYAEVGRENNHHPDYAAGSFMLPDGTKYSFRLSKTEVQTMHEESQTLMTPDRSGKTPYPLASRSPMLFLIMWMIRCLMSIIVLM